MQFSSKSVGWIATGILSIILGFAINSNVFCNVSCVGKGTIFLYLGILSILLGFVIVLVADKIKRRRK